MKLYNSYVVAKESIKNDKMMSAYMSEFVSFNVLDKDYMEKHKLTITDDDLLIPIDSVPEILPKDIELIVGEGTTTGEDSGYLFRFGFG